MVIDWQTAERIQCSTEERRQVVPLIETIVHLAEEARTEGLLTLEDRIESLEPPILALGVQLVVDGTDPDRINEILTARILSTNATGRTLLEQLIARWGILEIQAGDNPRIVKTQCFAFLGEDADELQRELDATLDERELKIVEEFSNIDGRVEDTFADMDKLLRLDRRAIQKALREIDTSRLSCALHGARSAVRGKIVVNMSKNAAARLATEGSDSSPKAVRESVSVLLEIIAKLAEHGEISASELDLQE